MGISGHSRSRNADITQSLLGRRLALLGPFALAQLRPPRSGALAPSMGLLTVGRPLPWDEALPHLRDWLAGAFEWDDGGGADVVAAGFVEVVDLSAYNCVRESISESADLSRRAGGTRTPTTPPRATPPLRASSRRARRSPSHPASPSRRADERSSRIRSR